MSDPTVNGQTVTTSSGLFVDSGSFSANYSDNETLSTTFVSQSGAALTVDFTVWNVEDNATCGFDSLSIYDGLTTGATLIGTFCTTSPGTIVSTNLNHALTFVFTSDTSVTEEGWEATISAAIPDTDGDSYANDVDDDDDNDGILDTVEDSCTAAPTGTIDWDQDFGTPTGANRANLQAGILPFTSDAVDGTTLTVSNSDPTTAIQEISIIDGFGFGNRVLEIEHSPSLSGSTTAFDFSTPVRDLTFSMQDIDADSGIGFHDRVVISAYRADGSVVNIDASYYGTLGNHITFTGNNTFEGILSQGNGTAGDTGAVLNLNFPDVITKVLFSYYNVLAPAPTNTQRIGIADLTFVAVCNSDFDNDGIINSQDTDSDNDGCPDALEGNGGFDYTDLDGDDSLGNSSDGSGTPINAGGIIPQTDVSSQNVGIQAPACDPCNASNPAFVDTDGDGYADACDLDDDNDGILDDEECPPFELQKVIAVMETYPTIKIDVRFHTDSRAPDNYNVALSDRRNKSTIKYLIEKGGINGDRLTGRGYGETQLTNKCSNGVKCTKQQHQLNRRSEFIIVSK